MKKLIISIVATASIALVAKADVALRNATSFENYPEGVAFDVGLTDNGVGTGEKYWSGGKEGQFEFIDVVAGAKTDRPKYWDGEDDAKALSIDTDAALSRHVATNNAEAQEIGDGLYFDSMVQFTATDAVPTVTPGDKLIVWLKEIPSEEEGGQSTYKLCVTAATWDDVGAATRVDYVNTNTEIAVDKDEWHRLTISAVINGDRPEFQVFIDGKIFQEGEVNKFLSLSGFSDENRTKLTSVSFQGKGAIDDLVWTTDVNDVFAPETTTVTVTYNGPEIDAEDGPFFSYTSGKTGGEIVFTDGSCSLMLGLGKTAEFTCLIASGWKVEGFVKGAEEGGYVTWTKSVENVTAEFTSLEIKITKPVAQIGETTYTSLTDALAAAPQAGATIKLLANIETDAAVEITKAVTIDLNGTTIKASQNDTEGNGVFWVKKGGKLTIVGNGTVNGNGGSDYKMAIWADEGEVVINSGSYINTGAGTHAQYDLIYVKNGGTVEINGGTFECKTPRWTLNSHNSLTGTFVVKGGMFYDYDPSKINTDEPTVTSWCADGYEAKKNGDYYEVAKTTEALKPGASATVTATTEVEALAKVELSVTVPDGVDVDTYKGYFKLSATDNGDGTWTVAAALNEDVVTPVIGATTDEDGAVTPAISFGSDGEVTINISNELPGLFYGVKYATTVGGVETATAIPGLTVTPKAGGTAGFFRVVVDFKEIPTPVAE